MSTFVLPHHGSLHDSDAEQLVFDFDRFVAAAQPSRPEWKHPPKELADKVASLNEDFRNVTADPETGLDEASVVFWR